MSLEYLGAVCYFVGGIFYFVGSLLYLLSHHKV